LAHEFKVEEEIALDATPEQVWEAITTGRGMDGWFMGANEVDPREGGAVRTSLPGWALESIVTVWEPPTRFVHTTSEGADGRLMAFEYLIAGRADGGATLRFVHSGFLPGDDWEEEYDALRTGDPMFLHTLAQYLKHFRGRIATPISATGPRVEAGRAWAGFKGALGPAGAVAEGDPARLTPDGLAPVAGVVDYVGPDCLGVRAGDGLYRFVHGLGGAVVLMHHLFSEVDRQAAERAWQAWLDRTFA